MTAKLLTTEKVVFNTALAERLLEISEIPGERPLRPLHVQYLTRCMHDGRFRPEIVNLATCYCRETDKEYRINGMHTCWAMLEGTDENHKPSFIVSLLKYEAETMNEVRDLYTTYDRGAARTKGHITQAQLVGTDELGTLTFLGKKLLAGALPFFLWHTNLEQRKHDPEEVAHLMRGEYLTLCLQVGEFLQQTPQQSALYAHVMKTPVVAAMLATWTKDAEASQEFWTAVRDGTNLEAGDPRLVLRNTLTITNTRENIPAGQNSYRTRLATREELTRWCLQAWNHWRNKKTISFLKKLDVSKPRPELI